MDDITRRDFVKQTIVGTAAITTAASTGLSALQAGAAPDQKTQIVSALGALFVPSKPGDPGYRELESHGITTFVMKQFPLDGLELFNTSARQFFDGKTFLELDEKGRTDYLKLVAEGSAVTDQSDGRNLIGPDATQKSRITDAELAMKLHAFYRAARRRILSTYYGNFPENEVKRDAANVPILKPGDTHQEVNPNTKTLVTGWDIAGYDGPMDWEEEQKARAQAKKTLSYWYDGDLIRLDPKRPAQAAAIKTSDGKDYYDVLVVGGGTSGCIVAGRIAERGINPKTGDRLRVAMIEGGDDWTVRDPAITPGIGQPIRRRMITYVADGKGPENGRQYQWANGDAGESYKIVGGCSVHYGATTWIPAEEDFGFYREASGVDWDMAKFGDPIQEVRDLYGVSTPSDHWWSKADHIWADGARALGLEVRVPECGMRNMLDPSAPGGLDRYDSKGTALPWAYIGLNNGLKIIANAEVQKVLIEKPAGGRPVAVGAVYTDKAGVTHEVRAARVIVALGAVLAARMMYKSGYGPKDYVSNLIVENPNVGSNLTGDVNLVAATYMAEPVTPLGGIDMAAEPWVSVQPRPWPELSVHIRARTLGRSPVGAANDVFAPAFGWDHKEFMRNANGASRIMTWRCHHGPLPATWRVPPTGPVQLEKMDTTRCNAAKKETLELVRAWHAKLSVKVEKAAFANNFVRDAKDWPPLHQTATTRAGSSAKNSVCSSDFDCHDIDNLMFVSTSVVPRTFFWSCGPTSVVSAYAWRRMVANHFSRGSSTKGFA
jgi:choline dehydrogenase-like flavoprotein